MKPNWFFHWIGGGYNTVQASSRVEALAKAYQLGESKHPDGVTLIPDESTLQLDPYYERTSQEDKRYSGMFD